MALIGEVFVADILGKNVLDPRGEEIGRVKDIAVDAGVRFPRAIGLSLEKKKARRYLPWEDLTIFNRRIISSRKTEEELPENGAEKDHLFIVRDILDKQIVDINGAKVVRVNDVKLTEEGGAVYVTDVDVGMRGILRRLGIERRGNAFFETIATRCATS
jgi:sporulation protein YlmC with PRC-barrel domain